MNGTLVKALLHHTLGYSTVRSTWPATLPNAGPWLWELWIDQCQRHPLRTILLNQDLPRLVHVIKSFNSGLQGSVPRTFQGVRNQVDSALRMVHSLISKHPTALVGFRVEVTVRAKSFEGRPSTSFSYQFPETGILAEYRG